MHKYHCMFPIKSIRVVFVFIYYIYRISYLKRRSFTITLYSIISKSSSDGGNNIQMINSIGLTNTQNLSLFLPFFTLESVSLIVFSYIASEIMCKGFLFIFTAVVNFLNTGMWHYAYIHTPHNYYCTKTYIKFSSMYIRGCWMRIFCKDTTNLIYIC